MAKAMRQIHIGHKFDHANESELGLVMVGSDNQTSFQDNGIMIMNLI